MPPRYSFIRHRARSTTALRVRQTNVETGTLIENKLLSLSGPERNTSIPEGMHSNTAAGDYLAVSERIVISKTDLLTIDKGISVLEDLNASGVVRPRYL